MEQILLWITENVLLVAIAGGLLLILLVICIVLATKKNPTKSNTADDSITCETETSADYKEVEKTTETKTTTNITAKTESTESITLEPKSEENIDNVEVLEVDDDKEDATPQKEVKNIYHITLRQKDDKWQVKKQNSTKAMKLFDTQLEAINYAKALAKNNNGSIRVHKLSGQIRKA